MFRCYETRSSLAVAFVAGFRAPQSTTKGKGRKERLEHPALSATLALHAAWASMALFFVYCGLECGTGLWIASVLHDGRGWTMQASSLMVSVYWGALTVGRFFIGAVSQHTTTTRLVRAAIAGATAGTCLIAISNALPGRTAIAGLVTATGLLVLGLRLSPIFPMLTHDAPRCVGPGHALNLIGFQTASGNLGFARLPIVMGTLMRIYSTEWLGSMLLVLALAMHALFEARERMVGRHVVAL